MSLQNGSLVIAPISTDYLTKGKEYIVFGVSNGAKFNITDDQGDILICVLSECAHLNHNDWQIKQ